MRKIILSQTDGNDFDAFFIGCEYSIIEGVIIGLADEKDVYIFEEGLGDYLPRKKYPTLSLKEIASYVVSKMGYFSPYTFFELDQTTLCTKYASLPNLQSKRKYKTIRTLFKGSDVTTERYKKMLSEVYPFSENLFGNCDVILFTSPWDWDVKEKDGYMEKIHQWMLTNYKDKRILIKKHPRDNEKYMWDDLNCIFAEEGIPAEVLIENINKHQDIVMMGTSTILLSMLQRMNRIYIFQFDRIHGEYERNLKEKIKLLEIEEKIIHL